MLELIYEAKYSLLKYDIMHFDNKKLFFYLHLAFFRIN